MPNSAKALQSAIFLLTIFSIILISGCRGSHPEEQALQPEAGQEAQPKQETTSTDATIRISSAKLEDRAFLRDEKGLQVAVRAVVTVTFEGKSGSAAKGACRLQYAGELEGQAAEANAKIGEGGTGSAAVTLINPAEGRLDAGKWEACCGLTAEDTETCTG